MIPNKAYDVLKWLTMIVLPALATAYVSLAPVWGWPYADEVVKTVTAVCALLGALLGISTAEYNKLGYEIPPLTAWDKIQAEIDEQSK